MVQDQRKRGRAPLLKEMVWIDLVTALNLAYALHAADDKALQGTEEGELARKLARAFRALKAKSGSHDEQYLVQVSAVVLSHSRGISRRKRIQLEEIEDALKDRDDQLGRLQGSRGVGVFLNVLYTKGGMMVFATLLMAAIGYFLAQTVGSFLLDFLPDDAKEGRAPSILSALFFAGIGKYASARWNDLSHNRIVDTYNRRVHRARLAYEQGKLDEIRIHEGKLRFLWKEFMGKAYPAVPSYALVIAADLAGEQQVHMRRVEDGRSLLGVIISTIFSWVKKKRKK